ncbi:MULTISPECIES: hypothetical protein [Burkholderiaceae]|uniref:hypothetical protein n=1 Tax=Burkholderiaceae TaxID=119060 RepID=UPI00119879F0|nr:MULTISPECIES: hypothetical protein [Burkholderiaceae]MBN3532587.1 hypothetical protein [Burkholderia cenocepacia]MCA8143305.1 hypothetical protein [Burkholderia multivorans]MCA8336984.1 hypothetical protein [Burkholderia multivorans]QDX23518.1 hypothetical protein FP568_21420 [Pandoraea pnomenusa]QGR93526.1 hypothetical protein FOC30_21795 [Burkholderia multivorans]
MSKDDLIIKSLATSIANLMSPPTDDEITRIIEENEYIDNDDTRDKLKGLGLRFDKGRGIIDQTIHVDYDVDEAVAMLEPVSQNQTPEKIHSAASRAVKIWEILGGVGSQQMPFDELMSKLECELESGAVDALTLVSLCLFSRDAARWHRELAAAVSGVIGSQKRYNQKNGSRDRKQKFLEMWRLGKYKTKTLCAEREHERFGVSFNTAIKWLQEA